MARPAATKDWQAIAMAAIAYKQILKKDLLQLQARVKTLESMVESMGTLIEKDLTGLLDADNR